MNAKGMLPGLLGSNGAVMGMEIRLAERVGLSDASALRRVAAELGSVWRLGLVVYRGQRLMRLAERIWAVPSALLLS